DGGRGAGVLEALVEPEWQEVAILVERLGCGALFLAGKNSVRGRGQEVAHLFRNHAVGGIERGQRIDRGGLLGHSDGLLGHSGGIRGKRWGLSLLGRRGGRGGRRRGGGRLRRRGGRGRRGCGLLDRESCRRGNGRGGGGHFFGTLRPADPWKGKEHRPGRRRQGTETKAMHERFAPERKLSV